MGKRDSSDNNDMMINTEKRKDNEKLNTKNVDNDEESNRLETEVNSFICYNIKNSSAGRQSRSTGLDLT